jgi:hypothetical protein
MIILNAPGSRYTANFSRFFAFCWLLKALLLSQNFVADFAA